MPAFILIYEENADTFEGNALLKADQVMKQCGEITVADDSVYASMLWAARPGVFGAYAGITPPIWKII
jgi:inosine/xanthosine triphosphate pyrophosphatase family protein